MPVEFEDHPFWDFSLKVYGSRGVPPACLALQERHGIDVNVVLFCAWVGHSGRGRLSADELKATLDAVAEWNEAVVCGLRAVRRRMKEGLPPVPDARCEALRKAIMKIEVDCEHAEQLALAATAQRPGDGALPEAHRAADAAANVAAYFAHMGARTDAADAENLAVILAPAFPGESAAALRDAWRAAAA